MANTMWFVCDRCGNLDNIRLTVSEGMGCLCARCYTGEWHDAFPETKYDPEYHIVYNRWNPGEFAEEPSFS